MLDLGCGNDKKKGAIGVDMIKNSQADVIADLESFPYPFRDESVDRINAVSLLEHLYYPKECVNEMHRILKKGGEVFLSVPFYFRLHGAFCDGDGRDYFRYTHYALKRMFEDFSEVRITPHSRLFRNLANIFYVPKINIYLRRYFWGGLDWLLRTRDRNPSIPSWYEVEAMK